MKTILSVFIVMIHCQLHPMSWNEMGGGKIHDNQCFAFFQKIFVDIVLDHSCVPVFFFISGYLFFMKFKESFTVYDYKSQLQKRIKGLMIPYLIANLVYFLVLCLVPMILNGNIENSVLTDFFYSFWSYGGNIPINRPLWYIRDLIVLSFLSPIIYYSLKCFKHYTLFVLVLLWMLDIWLVDPGFGCYPWVFFTFGAYIALSDSDIVEVFRSHFQFILCLFYPLLICGLSYVGFYYGEECALYLLGLKLTQILSIPFGFVVFIAFSKYITLPQYMVTATFFVFMYHYALRIPSRIISVLNLQESNSTLFLSYFGGVLIEILCLLLVYFALNKFLYRLSQLIVGGR